MGYGSSSGPSEATDGRDPVTLIHPFNELTMERCSRPREYFARVRAQGPVEYEHMNEPQIVGRNEVEFALRNPQIFSSEFAGIMGSEEPIIPLNVDPPEHVLYRRLLDPLFAPKRMAELQPKVLAHTDELIDSFIDRGACDFSDDIAVPLPCSTFLTLLGLPLDELRNFVHWKDVLIRPETIAATPEEAQQLQAKVAGEVYGRFAAEMADRRAHPKDDLVTFLTTAEIDGRRLTDSEILRTCFLLFSAGLDTVTVSLECIFQWLLDRPEARHMLATQPGSENALIEELLRWETPVQGLVRRVTQDIELGGCPLKKDQMVQVQIASANVDPNGLEEADVVDVTRGDKRHLSFGGGNHRCLGSHLARLELRVVVRRWHDRIPDYQLAPGATLQWNGSSLRGIDHMPLVWATSN